MSDTKQTSAGTYLKCHSGVTGLPLDHEAEGAMTTLTLLPLSPARSHGSVGLREYLERNERPGAHVSKPLLNAETMFSERMDQVRVDDDA